MAVQMSSGTGYRAPSGSSQYQSAHLRGNIIPLGPWNQPRTASATAQPRSTASAPQWLGPVLPAMGSGPALAGMPKAPNVSIMANPGAAIRTMNGAPPSITQLPTAMPQGVNLGIDAPAIGRIANVRDAYIAALPQLGGANAQAYRGGFTGGVRAPSISSPTVRAATAAQGDWGMNAAAQAQVDLLRAWGDERLAAAAESEIARGMGRSGAFDASQDRVAQQTRMEAASQLAEAAAEQGRLNQQVAVANAQLGTDAAIAEANARVQADQIRASLAEADAQNRLGAYQASAESYGRAQGLLNDLYLGVLGYNEGARQFDATNALDRFRAQTDASLGAYGAQTQRGSMLNDFTLGAFGAQTDRMAANNDAAVSAYNAATQRGASNNDAIIAAYNAATQRGATNNEARIAAYQAATGRFGAVNDARQGAFNAATSRFGTLADAALGRYNAVTGAANDAAANAAAMLNARTNAGQLALQRQTSTPGYLASVLPYQPGYAGTLAQIAADRSTQRTTGMDQPNMTSLLGLMYGDTYTGENGKPITVGGLGDTQRQALINWYASQGIQIPNLG